MANPAMKRGVFIVRAVFGHSIVVDGNDLGLDGSWDQVDQICSQIAALRKPGDGRGYARCRHDGNDMCWATGQHIETLTEEQIAADSQQRSERKQKLDELARLTEEVGGYRDE